MFRHSRFIAASILFLYASTGLSEPYKVKKGDSLYKIATDYGVSVQKLLKANPRVAKSANHAIWAGMTLVIPEGNPGTTSPPKLPNPPVNDLVPNGDQVPHDVSPVPAADLNTATTSKVKTGDSALPAVAKSVEAVRASTGSAPRPSSAGENTAADVYDGISSKGWIVTYNPSISSNILFIHASSAGGALSDLRYYAKVGADGKWTIYRGNNSRVVGNSVQGSPVTVMDRPSSVRMGQCNCQ